MEEVDRLILLAKNKNKALWNINEETGNSQWLPGELLR